MLKHIWIERRYMKEMPYTFVGFKIKEDIHITSKLVESSQRSLYSHNRDRYKPSGQIA